MNEKMKLRQPQGTDPRKPRGAKSPRSTSRLRPGLQRGNTSSLHPQAGAPFSQRKRIKIVQGDITEQETEAIVNAANTDLILGSGVAGAIHRKGGALIQEECNQKGPIPLGEAALTSGGNLKTNYVIHAASMSFSQTTTDKSLRDSVVNSLLRAAENQIKSVAFPAIGTGVAGFPINQCARIMIDETIHFLKQNNFPQEVRFVLFDEGSFKAFNRTFQELGQEATQ